MLYSKLELISLNQVLDISDEIDFVHEGNTGFGMPPMHRLSERGPLQDGVTDLGSRLDPRVIQLVITVLSDGWGEQYDLRSMLLDWLNPITRESLSLRFTLPDEVTIRQIDCFSTQGPIYNVGHSTNKSMLKTGFTLVASDPLFYDPNRRSKTSAAQIGTGFPVPVIVPMTFGEDDIDRIIQIDYEGTWLEYPEIELVGQMEDPIITHLDTGDVLDFTGYTVPSADALIIDLRYGYKTVVNKAGDNMVSKLTSDSDLTTWNLQPGMNNINLVADNIDGLARFVFRYYYRYLGV